MNYVGVDTSIDIPKQNPWGTISWKDSVETNVELPTIDDTREKTNNIVNEQIIYYLFESSTVLTVYSNTLEEELQYLFRTGKDEFFEDGMESDFSRNLVALVNLHGNFAIEILTTLIISEQVNSEVASEALRWIGHIEDAFTHLQRRRLLERSLYHSSAYVRDGAALGLSFMDDPAAIRSLQRAIELEKIDELRHDMEQVLEQLQDTKREQTQ